MKIVRRNANIVRVSESGESDSGPLVARVSISSSSEDAHNTCMGDTTLKNFVRQAKAGVPVCPNHEKSVITGITSNASQDGEGVVFCDLNIDRNIEFLHPEAGYANSDILIRQIENGRITRTSVGGYNGEMMCNVCDRNMLTDLGCSHWPGVTYTRDDPKDPKKKEEIRCVPTWENMDLGEVSTVWAGSNPDAEIMSTRAVQMLENGILDKSNALRVNRMYDASIDVSRAKPDKTIIDLGRSKTTMTEEEIKQLQEELDAEKAKREEIEKERDALKGDSDKLKQEKDVLRKETVEFYKTYRGPKLTGADLTRHEKFLESLDFEDLKTQRDVYMDACESPEVKERKSNVPTGSQTDSTDNSKEGEKETVLPPWLKQKKEEND